MSRREVPSDHRLTVSLPRAGPVFLEHVGAHREAGTHAEKKQVPPLPPLTFAMLQQFVGALPEGEVHSRAQCVDFEGEQLLHRMAMRGVEFVASGCMNRHLVESLKERHARRFAT